MNEDFKPKLVEEFKRQVDANVRAAYNALVATFTTSMSGVANSARYSVWNETVRPCCERIGNTRQEGRYVLSEERLARFADRIANAWADEVLAKVNEKVGQLEGAKAIHTGRANFVINGMRDGKIVQVVQTQIVNVSSKGKLFNQYPARIYVNGQFLPAYKLKA